MDPSPSPADWWARLPEWARRPGFIAAVLAGVAVVGGLAVVLVLRPPSGPAPTLTLPQAGAATTIGGAPPATTTSTTGLVTVHAAGAVASPGIYALAAGARVADAVTAAGGPLAEADLDRLNLAARLTDGDRVYVPRKGEAVPVTAAAASTPAGAATTSTAAGPIDLNTATVEQLDTLPGIGPATAQAIVAYRTRHGRFRSVTELLEVPGIGPSKLEAVRPLVRV